ncbi:MAG: SDR family NAD(P)-dependent oxidoreductase, partial [Acetobacteraceae bacterium]|nr:SDR family NAD(P)-dependent oxidoreductase [Acetobacteraceae bacterium]
TGLTIDWALYDDNGRWLGGVEGLALKRLRPSALRPATDSAAPDWLYHLAWEERPPLDPPHAPENPDNVGWLILADRGGAGGALAGRLQKHGFACKSILLDDPVGIEGGATWRSTPDPASAFGALLAEVPARAGFRLRGVIDLWPLDMPEHCTDAAAIEEAQRAVLGTAIGLINAVAASRDQGGVDPRIWIVTRMATAAALGDAGLNVAQATLWGLGRTAALEHPAIWGGLIDLGPDAAAPDALVSELLASDGEEQVAFRGETRYAPRLARLRLPAPQKERFDPDGGYLITGGSGFLGRELARWLVTRHGVRHLYLASRRGPDDPDAQAADLALRALGAEPALLKADVTDAGSVAQLIASLKAGPVPLSGVFHCAGGLQDSVLAQMDWAKVQHVLAPKVAGSWFLHEATRDLALDHFVLFSSILSLMGSAGQANYAAANAFLDALAARRHAEGLPALVLNWGPWAEAGIATHSGDKGRTIWRARGTDYIPPATGWRAFDLLIGGDIPAAAVTLTDWRVFLRQFANPPPLYSHLAEPQANAGLSRGLASEAILGRLKAAKGEERRGLLTDFVSAEANETLGLSEPIDPERPLRDYGLDSLMSVTLLNRLETSLGVRIPAATMIQGPSVVRLVSAIAPHLGVPEESAHNHEAAQVAADQWLVTITSRTRPRLRLFCFPFAGGGSAVFQTWRQTLDPAIEVVAVEPPGRLARIHEKPVTDIGAFVTALCEQIESKLDLPFAFFGHCLGGLTMFETGRRLLREKGVLPQHLFVSGARPPDRIDDQGRFEQRLMSDLMRLAEFRLHLPPFQQPDDVFAEIIRHFNIGASEQMLQNPELRALILPVVRAEFQMVSNYRFRPERPWNAPITCFSAKGDPYVSRRHALGWGRFTNKRFQLFVRDGAHFAIVDDADFMHAVINRELQM